MSVSGDKHVVVIAGPSGSGKNSIIDAIMRRYPNCERMVTATTRALRPGEQQDVDYHFMPNARFEEELARGNILEHYYREKTDTYYGTYRPDIEERLKRGKVVLAHVTMVGAKYLKEHYGATTFFIMPPSPDAFEKRVRARSVMSDAEWHERAEFTKREIAEEAPSYDYRITNEDGKLSEAVDEVVAILKKEGYTLD